MAARSFLRGHEIYCKDDQWFYSDNDEPTAGNPRACGYCGLPDNADDDSDPCLRTLPGVMNACCGHGQPGESYVQFMNGVTVRGFNRVERLDKELEEEKRKVKCQECNGTGKFVISGPAHKSTYDCVECGGAGRV